MRSVFATVVPSGVCVCFFFFKKKNVCVCVCVCVKSPHQEMTEFGYVANTLT